MVKCPLCDYEGTEKQVKAHISGKSDPVHKGFVGDDFEGYFADRRGDSQKETVDEDSTNSLTAKPTDSLTDRDREKENGLPEVRCKSCGRCVKYPELMPYKATCPGCDEEIREREAFETLEKRADEIGKDELAEPVEV